MQPTRARGSRVALYLAVCLGAGGLLSAALAGRGGLTLAHAAAVVLPLAIVYGVVCLSSRYVGQATPLATSTTTTIVANIAGSTLVASTVWLMLARGFAWVVARIPGLAGTDRLFAGESALLLVVGALVYLLALAAHYVVLGIDQARATEQRALESQLMAREAELKALRAQIEPHFLFNSLNSISALTSSDPAGARHMCLLLGEFLRASLGLGARERIRLADELALTQRFFDIERVRFGARLSFEQAIEPGVGECLVPPLLLQPLAENAVSHGIAGLLEGGLVRLEATRRDDVLRIVVENPFDGDRARAARRGVGLENVRRRLATHYGSLASLDVDDAGGRFRVTLALPAPEPGT
jgi:hypothetical protein